MPHKKRNTKHPQRASVKPSRSVKSKPAKKSRANKTARKTFVPKDVRVPKRLESLLKAEALQKAGIYHPTKKLDAKNFTHSQARHVAQLYKRTQAHGAFVRGKTERPFIRTMKGYQMNPSFKTVNKKNAKKIPGAIMTDKGVIIPRELMENHPRVLKDGTLLYKAKRLGKTREIYSGTLSSEQVLALIDQLEKGTFKMPRDKHGKEMIGSAMIFNAFTLRGIKYFATPKGLLDRLSSYADKFIENLHKYPTFAPLTMEFYSE